MENDKKDLIGFAEKTVSKYPKFAVWLQFSLLGGAIGGFLFGIGLSLIDIITKGNFSLILVYLLFGACIGFVVGFIPASLTGLYLAKTQFIILHKHSYIFLFLLGVVITFWASVGWVLYEKTFVPQDNLFFLFVAITGGITTMICGKLFLPKLDLVQAKPI